MEKIYRNLTKGARQYFKHANMSKAVIGLSGGIDSALALRLVADAIGRDNIFALIMPEKGLTKKANVDDSVRLCRKLGVGYHIIPINGFLGCFKGLPWKADRIAEMNTKSRIRANILFNYANAHNALVIGTSNKSELTLGYFTKYGDGAADIEVIGDLYKTGVFELARYLKLPPEIIAKVPSAELFHGHTDEKEIGASYERIDSILKELAKGKRPKGRTAASIMKRVVENAHKTKTIPIVRAR